MMVANTVLELVVRPRGTDEDTFYVEAFWTGEVDTWGKLTIRPVNGSPTLYLFPDEITVDE